MLVFVAPLLLAAALAPAAAQVPLGHAILGGADATTSAPLYWLLEPLQPGLTRLDASALPQRFRTSALHVLPGGQRVLVAGEVPTAQDDVVFTTAVLGGALAPLQPFGQGLRGRAVAMFMVAATAELVVVTDAGIHAAPATGGAFRPLTPITTRLGCLAAVLLEPGLVVATAVDTNGQALLWQVDLATQRVARLPLRMTGPLAVASGPRPGAVLVGEANGQLWAVDLGSLVRTAWLDLRRTPLRALWDDRDRQGWFAAVGSDLLRLGAQNTVGASVRLPGSSDFVLAYRGYQSRVSAYGSGCRGTGALLPEVGWQGRPVPGNDAFALTVANARASTVAAMMLGASATNVPLDRFGMPSCVLLTQPVLSLAATTTTTGFAQMPLAVPPDPTLAGVRLFVQWLVVDPGTNAASLVTSDGAAVEI